MSLLTLALRIAIFGTVLGLGAATGCNRPAPAEKKAPEPVAVDPAACGTYATKLCEIMGPDSAQCASMKGSTELMPPAACTAGLADLEFTKGKLGETRKGCSELATRLCKDVGEATQTCAMVMEQTPQFPPERCKDMAEHYDEVLADLKKMESQNQPIAPELLAAIGASDAPSFGPEDASVVIVEFSDFQCPFCSRTASVTADVKKKYGDRVRLVFRQFPLSFHEHANLAAQAALAAAAQGKFWEYHDHLFADQQHLDRAGLDAAAKAVGLNLKQFAAAVDGGTFAAQVNEDMKLGGQVNVDATPTMFLNGTRIANPTDFQVVSAAIDAALAAPPG